MIDFVEFSISEMGDFSIHCFLLEELSHNEELGLLQRIKVSKLKFILKEQSQAFNKLLYGGKIELKEVLESQQTYELIMKQIYYFCQNSQDMWINALHSEVNVSEFKQRNR